MLVLKDVFWGESPIILFTVKTRALQNKLVCMLILGQCPKFMYISVSKTNKSNTCIYNCY